MADILAAPEAVYTHPGQFSHASAIQRPAPPRLKICLIAETVHAGVGRHIFDLVSEFSGRGHEIHLIYSPIRTDASLIDSIRARETVKCYAVPMPRSIGASDIAAFFRILTYVRANGPFDAIHGHSSKGGGYARLLKLFGLGPVFYSPHAFITLSPLLSKRKRYFYQGLEWALSHLTDRILCTSRAEREHAMSLGLPESRLSLVVNGNKVAAAPPREIVRKRLAVAPREIVIGYAGRLEDQKAPERIIEAAKTLMPQLPDLVLVMIGDGPKREALEASMRGAGLEHRVRWLGPADARQFLTGFDMFVLPSRYEGCAYVLLEAISAGLPIICTPVGGTHEAVEPEVNGVVVGHDAPDQMVAAIRRLATSTELRNRMGEASRRRGELFTVPRMAQAVESLYRDTALERQLRNRRVPATASAQSR